MANVAVRCQGLVKSYGDIVAVDDVTLDVGSGELLALVGPSGCGKTTLLRLIAGFESPEAGSISINGRAVVRPGVWVPPEERQVGVVFQDYTLFPHMDVESNIAYGLSRKNSYRAEVDRMLSLVGLKGLERRMPHELSGGQQQRIALARALAPGPAVILLDEPFSNLDAGMRVQMRQEVRDILRRSGYAVVFVTHDQTEALFMGDRVAVMREGHIEQTGTPRDVFQSPVTRFVATFIGQADFLPARVCGCGLSTEVGTLDQTLELPAGGEVEVMVRPDDVKLIPSPQGSGRIVSKSFQGIAILYRVVLPSGLTLHSVQTHTFDLEEGTSVEVQINPGHDLICFKDGRPIRPES
jgi:iron(III) transport system ATP-binding protein